MTRRGLLLERLADLRGERAALFRECLVWKFRFKDLGELFERRSRKEVGGDQVRKDTGVVGRTEAGVNQTAGPSGIAVTAPGQGIGGHFGQTLERVRPGAVEALLLAECLHDERRGVLPALVEAARVAGRFPIAVREAHRVAQRVDLPLALVQFGLHLGAVFVPFAAGRSEVERVGVGIDQHAARLAANDAGEQGLELRVAFRERQVGPHLRRGIPQPHGVDVACDDEGVGLAIERAGPNRGVERVRKAVFEEPAQLRIRDGLLHFDDLGIDGVADEVALVNRGPAAWEGCVRGQ